jgi:hypothetical protein
MFKSLADIANNFVKGQRKSFKPYKKKNYEITSYVQREYELVAKGYYMGIYMAVGLAIGAGLGTALSSAIGPEYLALGIGPGLAIGIAIGALQDNKAVKEDKVY